jgi:signal transduction histidine kinase
VRVGQVLTNLVGNAVKFTEAGSVDVRVERLALQPHLVCFEVRDTGIGMDAASLDRIFEPFTQAESSTTRRYGGTGLGLTITWRLVELMGGRCGAESTPGRGSRFWIELPLPASESAGAEHDGAERGADEQAAQVATQ